jgi:hypothetical protein
MIGVLVAIWLCVPETNQLPIVAIVPGVLVALEFAVGRQAPIEWYVAAAVCIGWGGLFGASGRTSAFIGAMFAWWVLLLPIVVEAMRRKSTGRRDVVVMFIGVAAVIVFARTGGIASDGTIAVLLLPVVAAASLLLGLAAASLADRG